MYTLGAMNLTVTLVILGRGSWRLQARYRSGTDVNESDIARKWGNGMGMTERGKLETGKHVSLPILGDWANNRGSLIIRSS